MNPFAISPRPVLLALGAALLLGSPLAQAASDWSLVSADVFKVPDAIYRTQGMTTDGSNLYFAWQFGLEKTDMAYNVVASNSSAVPFSSGIPDALSAQGYNHIGDIDQANGTIYASLDSSTSGYNTPAVALYRASDLGYTGTYFTLNPPHGTHDVASWVAVDAGANLAYGMAYGNATEMAVYNLNDFSFVKYISLSQSMDQVQGGKIFGDWMYMASDDSSRSVYRANLLTGAVETLFSVKQPYSQEVEGLAVTADAAGNPLINLLVINDPNNSGQNLADPALNVTLYHYGLAAAVPEPGTAAMALAGLLGLGGLVRRRRGKA